MSLVEYCQQGNFQGIENLIKQKYDLNQIDDQGRSLLHHCCEHHDISCIKLIYENDLFNKQLLNLQDHEGFSALHLACLNGQTKLVKYLCEQGADTQLVDNELHSIIHWITVCGHVDLFDLVMKYATSIHTADANGVYPIHYASQQNIEILKKLIEYKADVNCLDQQKRTPFIWASSAGIVDALRILYKSGANPFHVDKDSLTALHCAANRGHEACIRLLVEFYGCSVESEDRNGCTPLFYAVTFHHTQACQVLLDFQGNPNHQDNRGRTPSHCAFFQADLDCLKCLLKSQANIWIKNRRGDYPIHESICQSNLSSTNLLSLIRYVFQLYPKYINIRNDESRTALHLAASFGSISLCRTLIECCARVNCVFQTSSGNFITPYDLAIIRGHTTCAEYLLYSHGGQRGNLIVQIFARRIQKFFRQYRRRKYSLASQRRQIFAKTTQQTLHKLPYMSRAVPIVHTPERLLTQAKICLDNKHVEDRISNRNNEYLINQDNHHAKHRPQIHSKSKINTSNNESNRTEKIIIHKSNSVSTSVKLYERHKLIAEELFKMKHAKIHNQPIVINRSLYKILIENAFNPQYQEIEEIEKYLETLSKAYELELEAIRKRTKSLSPRRSVNPQRH